MLWRSIRWLGASLLGLLVVGAPSGLANPAEDLFVALRANRVVPPAAAPDVTLPALEGGTLRLADLRGRVVVVGFFVTT